MRIIKVMSITDAFQVDAPFQWPMKTSEYLWYRKKTLAWRRLNKFQILNCFELCIAFLLSVLYSASSFLYAQFQIICLQYLKETPDTCFRFICFIYLKKHVVYDYTLIDIIPSLQFFICTISDTIYNTWRKTKVYMITYYWFYLLKITLV